MASTSGSSRGRVRGPHALRRLRSIRIPVGAALAATVVLILALALEGWRATAAQRTLARTALATEAAVVASRLTSVLVATMYSRLASQFGLATARADEGDTPQRLAAQLASAGARVDACRCLGDDPAIAYIAGRPGSAAVVLPTGAMPAFPNATASALLARAQSEPPDSIAPVELLIVTLPGHELPFVFAFRRMRTAQGRVIVGIVSDARAFFGTAGSHVTTQLRAADAPQRTGGRSLGSAVEVRLQLQDGRIVYQSGPIESNAVVGSAVAAPRMFQRLQVTAALRADVASAIVDQRLPAARGRLLLAVVVAAVAMCAVALVQYRRERDLARLRHDFTTSVSHELRTPLAQILLFGETLALNRVRSEVERHDAARVIVQETRRLMHMVENVLHFARAERHVLRISPEPIAIGSEAAAVVEGFRPLMEGSHVQCVVEVSHDLHVDVDRGAFRQMLLNLLDNAAKYGPPGQSVMVTVSASTETVCVAVDDEGPGIPVEERETIWSPFIRGEDAFEARVPGSGIGLAVVRELAALHGGKASVCDGPRGARFAIELPRTARPPQPAAPSGAPPTARPMRRAKAG